MKADKPIPCPKRVELDQDARKNRDLELYLAQLEQPLIGLVSESDRDSFIEQTRFHLEQGIEFESRTGESLSARTAKVLKHYGDPRKNADEFLCSWFQYRLRTPLARNFGHANLIAFGVFQAAAVVYYVILQLNVYLPSEATYRIPWRLTPQQVRAVWPEPLPFPEFTPSFFVTIAWPILAPILAGIVCGLCIPARASGAVYRGLMPLIILSFVMGALLLPVTQGLLFALFQVVFWLPVGCGTAHLTSELSRIRRGRLHRTREVRLSPVGVSSR